MSRSLTMMFGVVAGIVVGLIIAIFVVKGFNKDGKFKTQYDEKQEIARGKGFKYALYCTLVYEAIMCILSIGDINLPLDNFSLHFLAIFIGIVVLETYCIFNDAFIGLNTNGKRYAIVCVFVAIINFLSAIAGFVQNSKAGTNIIPSTFANLMVGIMFLLIGIEFVIKLIIDKKKGEEV